VLNTRIHEKSWKEVGDPFAERSRRLSHNFAVVNLVHSRLSPTQPFSERLLTLIGLLVMPLKF
ncbi:MAG: hypothetical protein LBK82_04985, partial [Planctomycetaceae bacterium]|nr:hypothetical protein [Planctomycetaceae bacterium]